MRRILIGTALAALVLTMMPSHADEPQTVKGSVLLPMRFTDAESGFPGLARRVYTATMGNTNGEFGWVFQVDPATVGGAFTLTVDGDLTGQADLDILYYYELGDDVYGETPPSAAPDGEFYTRAPGGESGTVPDDVEWAIVFMPTGLNASFTYTATPAA